MNNSTYSVDDGRRNRICDACQQCTSHFNGRCEVCDKPVPAMEDEVQYLMPIAPTVYVDEPAPVARRINLKGHVTPVPSVNGIYWGWDAAHCVMRGVGHSGNLLAPIGWVWQKVGHQANVRCNAYKLVRML